MSIKTTESIKQLNTQINKIESDIIGLKSVIANNNKEINLKVNILRDLKQKLKNLNSDGKIRVTEHAVLRYLERIIKMPISDIENQILEESIVTTAKLLGNGTYQHSKGFKVKIKDNNVVTIINDSTD